MNKEVIEKAKPVLEKIKRHIEYQETIEKIEEYIQCLEQKESILDKVTEFATKIATENSEKYNSENQKEVDFSEWNLALEILNIIEEGKK